MKNRVFAGHCGMCGCAVVKPTEEEVQREANRLVRYGLYDQRQYGFTVSGHIYMNHDTGPELVRVRCHRHIEGGPVYRDIRKAPVIGMDWGQNDRPVLALFEMRSGQPFLIGFSDDPDIIEKIKSPS